MNTSQLDFLRKNCNKVLFNENNTDHGLVGFFIRNSSDTNYLNDILTHAYNDLKIVVNNVDKDVFIKRTEEILFINFLLENNK